MMAAGRHGMKSAFTVTMAALALGTAGCVSGGGTADDSTVEIIHWWTAGGEKEAIEALLGDFAQQHPNEPVTNTAVMGSTMARATIATRMLLSEPPDTFQANGGWDLLSWVLYNNIDDTSSKMETIDDTAADQHWADYIPSSVLDTVSYKGHIYAVPLDIHRLNTMFYNVSLFDQSGLPMPQKLDDLFAAAAAFQAMGVKYPLSLGIKDGTWLPLLFFENLLVARAGGAFYKNFMRGLGDPFGPEIAATVDDLATFFSYTNPNATSLTWNQAADRVIAGDAALTVMGDWAKAYMASMARINYDFGAVPTPGTTGTFIFTTDTFGHPIGALNPQGTTDMLVVFGSKDGQDTFNLLKGSISPRSDSDTTKYDELAKQTIADFQAASANETLFPATAILAPQAFLTAVDMALQTFLSNRDKSVLIHTIANYYDILKNSILL